MYLAPLPTRSHLTPRSGKHDRASPISDGRQSSFGAGAPACSPPQHPIYPAVVLPAQSPPPAVSIIQDLPLHTIFLDRATIDSCCRKRRPQALAGQRRALVLRSSGYPCLHPHLALVCQAKWPLEILCLLAYKRSSIRHPPAANGSARAPEPARGRLPGRPRRRHNKA